MHDPLLLLWLQLCTCFKIPFSCTSMTIITARPTSECTSLKSGHNAAINQLLTLLGNIIGSPEGVTKPLNYFHMNANVNGQSVTLSNCSLTKARSPLYFKIYLINLVGGREPAEFES